MNCSRNFLHTFTCNKKEISPALNGNTCAAIGYSLLIMKIQTLFTERYLDEHVNICFKCVQTVDINKKNKSAVTLQSVSQSRTIPTLNRVCQDVYHNSAQLRPLSFREALLPPRTSCQFPTAISVSTPLGTSFHWRLSHRSAG